MSLHLAARGEAPGRSAPRSGSRPARPGGGPGRASAQPRLLHLLAAQRGLGAVVLACLVAAAASLARSRAVNYDPLSWLVWGRELAGLHLHTTGGPAWKPLPVLVDVLLAPLGTHAAEGWLVIARAGGLVALAAAYRLAAALSGRPAGLLAATALAASAGWLGDLVQSGMSEPLLAALCLLAVEMHLEHRPRAAFGLLVAAALLRPEVWPFLGAYGLVLWLRVPALRRVLVVSALAVLVLWFGFEWWGSGHPLRSAARAADPTQGGPLLTAHPGWAVLQAMRLQVLDLTWAGVLAALALAAVGARVPSLHSAARRRAGAGVRDRAVVLALGALAAAWVAVVSLMTEVGISAGEPRCLVVAVALLCVVAGVGWAAVLRTTGRLLRSRRPSGVAAGAVAAGLVVALLAGQGQALRLRWQQLHVEVIRGGAEDASPVLLAEAVRQVGGRAALARCGRPATGPYQRPLVAWVLRLPLHEVGLVAVPPGVVLRASGEGLGRPATPVGYRPVPLHGRPAAVWQVYADCPRR